IWLFGVLIFDIWLTGCIQDCRPSLWWQDLTIFLLTVLPCAAIYRLFLYSKVKKKTVSRLG
ncbi:MAG: hypothetical protein Q9M92_11755, partial [Enterobacterales bacterium]|nr:hypothetical protein [Enterobacterales bacterium]